MALVVWAAAVLDRVPRNGLREMKKSQTCTPCTGTNLNEEGGGKMGERCALGELGESAHLPAFLAWRNATSRTWRLVALFSHNPTFGSVRDRGCSAWRGEVGGGGRGGRVAMHRLLVQMRGP
jgi:hypothetical protein